MEEFTDKLIQKDLTKDKKIEDISILNEKPLSYELCLSFLKSLSKYNYHISKYTSTKIDEYMTKLFIYVFQIHTYAIEIEAYLQYQCRSIHNIKNNHQSIKFINSKTEVICFLNKIIDETKDIYKYYKTIAFSLQKINIEQTLFESIYENCFQDIYVLEYVVKIKPPKLYFLNSKIFSILKNIYHKKIQEINDKEKWTYITSDRNVNVYSHPLLPHPDDLKIIKSKIE